MLIFIVPRQRDETLNVRVPLRWHQAQVVSHWPDRIRPRAYQRFHVHSYPVLGRSGN